MHSKVVAVGLLLGLATAASVASACQDNNSCDACQRSTGCVWCPLGVKVTEGRMEKTQQVHGLGMCRQTADGCHSDIFGHNWKTLLNNSWSRIDNGAKLAELELVTEALTEKCPSSSVVDPLPITVSSCDECIEKGGKWCNVAGYARSGSEFTHSGICTRMLSCDFLVGNMLKTDVLMHSFTVEEEAYECAALPPSNCALKHSCDSCGSAVDADCTWCGGQLVGAEESMDLFGFCRPTGHAAGCVGNEWSGVRQFADATYPDGSHTELRVIAGKRCDKNKNLKVDDRIFAHGKRTCEKCSGENDIWCSVAASKGKKIAHGGVCVTKASGYCSALGKRLTNFSTASYSTWLEFCGGEEEEEAEHPPPSHRSN